MHPRLPLPLCALLAAIPLWVTSATLAEDLETLCRIGRFSDAQAVIDAGRQSQDASAAFLRSAGAAAAELREHEQAAELYAALALAGQADPDAYLEAKRSEWQQRKLAAAGLNPAWEQAAREGCARAMAASSGRRGRERQLALELTQVLVDITEGAQTPLLELRTDYPASDVVLLAAKQSINTISTEPDDTRRVELIRRFLLDYPDCYWRHHAYRYWLFSAWRLNKTSLLEEAGSSYLAEYGSHATSMGAVSRYYFDAGYDLKRGRELAERCVAAYELELGCDGSQRSLEALDRETRALPSQPDHHPPGRRSQLMDYLGSRFNLARYYLESSSPVAALRQLEPVLAAAPFGPEDEESLAPFYLCAGEAYEAQGNRTEAFRHYLGAAISGDSRQRYSAPAAGKLAELGPQVSTTEQRAMIETYLGPALAGVPMPRFTEVAERSGLGSVAAQRAAWADLDGDLDPDLLLDGKAVYINDGSARLGRLKDAGLALDHSGGVFGDYDNDGDPDVYCFGSGRRGDALYRNDRGKFTDVTASAGNPVDISPTEAAAWIDYDRDGYLDLYAANFEARRGGDDARSTGEPSLLYRSNGRGSFRMVPPVESGMQPPFGEYLPARGLSPADLDGNGWPDLQVSNYRLQEDITWLNEAGKFSDKARMLGLAGRPKQGYWGHSLGSAWGDADGDGDLDLFTCNLAHLRYSFISDRSQLLINGAGTDTLFANERIARGIAFSETNTDPVFGDFNADGHLDLFFTANFASRPSYFYLNDGKGQFHDTTFLAGARVANSYGCAVADYEEDGDLDILACSSEGVKLLRNDSPPQGWVAVRLVGGMAEAKSPASDGLAWSNAQCIGARVTVRAGSGLYLRELQSARGVGCGDGQVLHFGLGGNTRGGIRIHVRYPSGREWNTVVTEAGGTYTFHEVDALKSSEPSSTADELVRSTTRSN